MPLSALKLKSRLGFATLLGALICSGTSAFSASKNERTYLRHTLCPKLFKINADRSLSLDPGRGSKHYSLSELLFTQGKSGQMEDVCSVLAPPLLPGFMSNAQTTAHVGAEVLSGLKATALLQQAEVDGLCFKMRDRARVLSLSTYLLPDCPYNEALIDSLRKRQDVRSDVPEIDAWSEQAVNLRRKTLELSSRLEAEGFVPDSKGGRIPDMVQWLERGLGRERLVVLAQFEEGARALRASPQVLQKEKNGVIFYGHKITFDSKGEPLIRMNPGDHFDSPLCDRSEKSLVPTLGRPVRVFAQTKYCADLKKIMSSVAAADGTVPPSYSFLAAEAFSMSSFASDAKELKLHTPFSDPVLQEAYELRLDRSKKNREVFKVNLIRDIKFDQEVKEKVKNHQALNEKEKMAPFLLAGTQALLGESEEIIKGLESGEVKLGDLSFAIEDSSKYTAVTSFRKNSLGGLEVFAAYIPRGADPSVAKPVPYGQVFSVEPEMLNTVAWDYIRKNGTPTGPKFHFSDDQSGYVEMKGGAESAIGALMKCNNAKGI